MTSGLHLANAHDVVLNGLCGLADATDTLQYYLSDDAVDNILIPFESDGIVHTGPLFCENISNRDIVLEHGVHIDAIESYFVNPEDHAKCVFSFLNCYYIRIIGDESVISMDSELYTSGESRHCLSFAGCSNIEIMNLECRNSGGEGVYIRDSSANEMPSDYFIHNVRCIGNLRNGIAIITGRQITVEDCFISETGQYIHEDYINVHGTNGPGGPQAGIDIEPNYHNDILENITIRNCTFQDNLSKHIVIGLHSVTSQNRPSDITITIEGCTMSGITQAGIVFDSFRDPDVQGEVKIDNCLIKDTRQGLCLHNWIDGSVSIEVSNTVFDDAANPPASHAQTIRVINNDTERPPIHVGNLKFDNVYVTNIDPDEYAYYESHYDLSYPVRNVTGKLIVANPDPHLNPPGIPDIDLEVTTSFRKIYASDEDDQGGDVGKTDAEPFFTQGDLCTGDFNGDGMTDILAKHESDRAIYIADGTGGFNRIARDGTGQPTGTPPDSFFTYPDAQMYPGDYNGNGRTDIFVKGFGTHRAMFLATATGTMDMIYAGDQDDHGGDMGHTDSEAFFTQGDLHTGDFNGDGRTDLFVRHTDDRAIYIATGNGGFNRVARDGVGQPTGTPAADYFTHADAQIYTGDYNGDGRTDLFIKGFERFRAMYLATPAGTFTEIYATDEYCDDGSTGDSSDYFTDPVTDMTTGDYNGDGLTDLFVKGHFQMRALYLSTGSGYFNRAFRENNESGSGTVPDQWFIDGVIYPGDYNDDDMTDFFVRSGEIKALLLSRGDGMFITPFLSAEEGYGGLPTQDYFVSNDSHLYIADFNGDGSDDIFTKGFETWRAMFLSNMYNEPKPDPIPDPDPEIIIMRRSLPQNTIACTIHPNPFNPIATIDYFIPKTDKVQVTIYDIAGRIVSKLVDDHQVAGDHSIMWNGRSDRGSQQASGVYFCRIEACASSLTKRMVLLK